MTHRCLIERRTRDGWMAKCWRAECSCGFEGRKRWHPLLAEREADRHLGEPRVLVTAPDAEPRLMTGPQVSDLLLVQAERYAAQIIALECEEEA